mmetsp:Transcript_14992/g.20970  ORF Transcript_14992/g.20970 Transcript_14992/m.20970 type:complete len:174 (+) Transcript_14992:1-522(+)
MEAPRYIIREANTDEHEALGRLMVDVYSQLEGFPTKDEQPKYYQMLLNVGSFSQKPYTKIIVSLLDDKIVGGVVYFSDMSQYGSGGTATQEKNASGFRLLAVDPSTRGLGIGKALVNYCIQLAREANHKQVIIHSTHAMKVAWGMYEALGFKRAVELDFMQEKLQVFGFRLEV